MTHLAVLARTQTLKMRPIVYLEDILGGRVAFLEMFSK